MFNGGWRFSHGSELRKSSLVELTCYAFWIQTSWKRDEEQENGRIAQAREAPLAALEISFAGPKSVECEQTVNKWKNSLSCSSAYFCEAGAIKGSTTVDRQANCKSHSIEIGWNFTRISSPRFPRSSLSDVTHRHIRPDGMFHSSFFSFSSESSVRCEWKQINIHKCTKKCCKTSKSIS